MPGGKRSKQAPANVLTSPLLVVGMHNSGTSILMAAFAILGMEFTAFTPELFPLLVR